MGTLSEDSNAGAVKAGLDTRFVRGQIYNAAKSHFNGIDEMHGKFNPSGNSLTQNVPQQLRRRARKTARYSIHIIDPVMLSSGKGVTRNHVVFIQITEVPVVICFLP